MQMTDPAPEGESLQDLVSRISDVLRFVFDQHRDDMVVLVGDDEVNRALLSQLQDKAPPPAPRTLAPDAYAINATDIVSGRTRIRRINETLHVVP
jgi:broad specificity phosphatase PhoE